jgi:hypothetical protein
MPMPMPMKMKMVKPNAGYPSSKFSQYGSI